MREIKFRSWQKQKREMFEVGALQLRDPRFVVKLNSLETWTLDEVELMQFTGFKDKHGVLIYEGDIVRGDAGDTCVVEWQENIDRDRDWATANGFGMYFDDSPANGDIEVIGNIYENPELVRQP